MSTGRAECMSELQSKVCLRVHRLFLLHCAGRFSLSKLHVRSIAGTSLISLSVSEARRGYGQTCFYISLSVHIILYTILWLDMFLFAVYECGHVHAGCSIRLHSLTCV